MSRSSTYFVAATTVTFGPTSACTRASRSRISSGDGTDHSLCTAGAPAAPVREEQLRVAPRAEVDAFDDGDAGAPQPTLGGAPQIEVPVEGQVGVEERRDILRDLVAARTDGRPDDRRLVPVAEHRGTGLDDAFREAAPARVQNGERARTVGPRDRDREAIRGKREHRLARLVAPEAVALRPAPAGAVHRWRVNLAVERQPFVVDAERRARAAAVLRDALRIVAGAAAQVERLVDA